MHFGDYSQYFDFIAVLTVINITLFLWEVISYDILNISSLIYLIYFNLDSPPFSCLLRKINFVIKSIYALDFAIYLKRMLLSTTILRNEYTPQTHFVSYAIMFILYSV